MKTIRKIKDFVQGNKILFQAILGLLFVGFGLFLIKKEQVEVGKAIDALFLAKPVWILWGLALLALFIVVQGMMYQQSFRAIHEKIGLGTGVSLYLKRNLVSVFVPAGMLTNMLFFNRSVEQKEGVSKTQIYFASTIFSFCSILSAVIIGIPALLWLFLKGSMSSAMIWGIVATAAFLGFLVYVLVNIIRKGSIYRFVMKRIPSLAGAFETLLEQSFSRGRMAFVLALSVVIEVIGITHLFISVEALGGHANLEMAIVGYAIVLLLLMSSPFLRGIGAVEAALTYSLVLYGLPHVLALSVAFLFRFFEFWAVLVAGLFALISKKNNLFLRVFPAFLLFILGIINIVSGITPALPNRLAALQEIVPLDAIHASVWLVILAGILMLALSVFLIRGLRNAWFFAMILVGLSLVAHVLKGIDWEEATFAFVTLLGLVIERKQYFIHTDFRLAKRSFLPLLFTVLGILVFGTFGFYLLEFKHFQADLNVWESFKTTLSAFFLFDGGHTPGTPFARDLLFGVKCLGGVSMAYFAFLLLKPLIQRNFPKAGDDIQRARALVEKHGQSSLDYFKTYADKTFWFSETIEGFVAFKTSRNYAIALENPVCPDLEALEKIVPEFDEYCRENGLRSAFYRVPESHKSVYEQMGKYVIPIGEEAVVQLDTWSMAGGDKSNMRNAIHKLTKTGYTFQVNQPPQKDFFLQQLKATSGEWLHETHRSEMVFSQGQFKERELKDQIILTIQNPEQKIVGFINLIPDFTKGEANFDLMRKTEDAPNGTMDFLFSKMLEYLKEAGYKTCTLGMVPLSGINEPGNMQERVIKLAYEKMKQFGHYKSLRDYKEKFDPTWQMMYLVYNAPFDLIYIPGALGKVFEP
ncbi:MAG: phosphatidylglycerol lysyltransferase domain-containing protein [Bacteroidales bacterium]